MTKTEVFTLIQSIFSFLTFLVACIAIFEYNSNKKQSKSNFQNTRIQKAIDMVKYYKTEILDSISEFSGIIEGTKFEEFCDTLDIDSFEVFDYEELKSLSGKNDTELSEIKREFFKHLSNYLIERKKATGSYNSSIDEAAVSIESTTKLNLEMREAALNPIELLNRIEYFSIHFTTELADHSVIYDILHQTFLSTITKMYFFIAITNKVEPQDRFYNNTIELFNRWYNIDKERKDAYKNLNQTTKAMIETLTFESRKESFNEFNNSYNKKINRPY